MPETYGVKRPDRQVYADRAEKLRFQSEMPARSDVHSRFSAFCLFQVAGNHRHLQPAFDGGGQRDQPLVRHVEGD